MEYFGHKREWNHAISSDMDGPGDDKTKWSKSEKDKHYTISLICGINQINFTYM